MWFRIPASNASSGSSASHIGQVAWENLGEIIDAAEAALSAYNQRTET